MLVFRGVSPNSKGLLKIHSIHSATVGTVDGNQRSGVFKPVEVGSLSTIIYDGFYTSQVVSRISSINSMT